MTETMTNVTTPPAPWVLNLAPSPEQHTSDRIASVLRHCEGRGILVRRLRIELDDSDCCAGEARLVRQWVERCLKDFGLEP